jgi:hypothetical protein
MMLLLASAVLVSGCSDSTTPGCFVSDEVTLLDERRINSERYYLVLRVTGWQDKVEFLELYDKQPEFGDCNRSKFAPIDAQDLALNNQYVSEVVLKNRKLQIIYKSGKDKTHPAKNLKLR